MLEVQQRKHCYRIGYLLNNDAIMEKINEDKENQNESMWLIIKGILQSPFSTQKQCNTLDWIRDLVNKDLAFYFNMNDAPCSAGEHLFQHALMYGKDELVLNILEDEDIDVSYETSELRSTPLLLAMMNHLSPKIIEKLCTTYSILRPNNQDLTPYQYAKKYDKQEFQDIIKTAHYLFIKHHKIKKSAKLQ